MGGKCYEKRKNDFLKKISDMYLEYDFSNFEYIDVFHKSTVICGEHGIFKRSPVELQKGKGCPICIKNGKTGNKERFVNSLIERRDKFIKDAVNIFGDRYDYSEIDYINTHTAIKIICPEHGEFEQTPHTHLQSETGCTFCSDRKFNYVKLYKESDVGMEIGTFYKLLFTHKKSGIKFIKIGITKSTIDERYKKGYDDFTYEILDQTNDTNYNCAVMERCYKNNNKNNRFFIPDDISFCGRTETYNYDEIQHLAAKGTSLLRNSLLEKQGGICPLCGKVPVRPVLDHDHSKRVGGSGLCRGTICSNCNVMIAKIENNCARYGISQKDLPQFLRNFADSYKESEQEPFLHPSEKPKAKLLGKREFARVIKYWPQLFPKRKQPVYKEKMKLTKEWEDYIERANKIHYSKYI